MQPADLFAVAAPAAQPAARTDPRPDDASAFARVLGNALDHTGDGRCGTSTTPGKAGDGRELPLGDRPVRGARPALAWAAFLQDMRSAGLQGGPQGDKLGALQGLIAGGPQKTDLLGAGPKPAPNPFTEALDALGAAIQAALQDPAANPAAPGQLPAPVQSALDQVLAAAPPQLAGRVQAFADRLAERLGALLVPTGEADTPAAPAGPAIAQTATPPPTVAKAVLEALGQAGQDAATAAPLMPERDDKAAGKTPAAAAAPETSTAPADGSAPTASPGSNGQAAASLPAEAGAPSSADAAAASAADAPEAPALVPGQATASSADSRASAAAAAVRIVPESVSHLAAAMARKMEGGATRFDLELHPSDLGRVDVRLRIEADGRIAAQLAFDNPVAAADMRGRADELRRQLEQAGFNVASEDLSFSDRESSGFQRHAQGEAPDPAAARERGLRETERAARLADDADRLHRRVAVGLDVRV